MERREEELASRWTRTDGSAALGAARIEQVERELAEAKEEVERETRKGDELSAVNRMLEESVEALKEEMTEIEERHRMELSEQKTASTASVSGAEQRFSNLQIGWEKEVVTLKRQLKWYAENQAILDQDSETMKAQREEIASLKSQIAKSKAFDKDSTERGRRKDKEKLADAKRIQDLERQARENVSLPQF